MPIIMEPARETEVVAETEVLILGGGPAGIAAATAAARTGARTLLLEKYGFLGGMGTAAMVTNFCGLHASINGSVQQVVRGVADEYGAKGIRVNSISPGLTASPMAAPHLETPGLLDAFLKNYPLGRLNTSEDIAAAAVFLGSDECYMTGQNLQVNGGLTLRRNPLPSEIEESVMAAMAAAQAE